MVLSAFLAASKIDHHLFINPFLARFHNLERGEMFYSIKPEILTV